MQEKGYTNKAKCHIVQKFLEEIEDKMGLTSIFCSIDDFCKEIKIVDKNCISGNRKRNRKFRLSVSEIATIVVYFHLSNYRNFKHFYLQKIMGSKEFPNTVSYNRFVELMPVSLIVLAMFQLAYGKDKCSGTSFIDSTILKVCKKCFRKIIW